jgi:S1-C subfamily serine protease
VITANVIHRVFRIAGEELAGTAFAIDIEDRQYLVTARHVVEGLNGACTISLFQDRDWSTFPVTVIGHAQGDIDISVLAPSRKHTPDIPLPLPASADGLIYGQDAYFLGFPYGILTKFIFGQEGFPLPLVKRATVSALDQGWFLLDA